MARYDVAVIGAGSAGLSAGALLQKEGKKVIVLDRAPYLGGRGMAVPDEGFKLNVGRAPARGLGLGDHEDLRVPRQAPRPRPVQHGHERVGPRGEQLGLDPRPLLRREGRAEEGDHRAPRDALRGARQVGRPAAPGLDPPVHVRPGRDRPLRVHHRARVHDRALVRPLGERQPLRPQAPLRGEALRRLLVLAGEGLGRALPGPGRRADRERRRAAARGRASSGS